METQLNEHDKKNYFQVKSQLNWDQYFMLQAMIASFKSKDPSTKVGAVIVDKNNHQVTMGYNGFVSGIDESKLPWGKDQSASLEHQKYAYVVHAETNAILHSSQDLEGTRAYVTLFPCHECAKLIASSKVSEVIFLSDKYHCTEGNRIAKRIFDLAGIKYRQLEMTSDITGNLNQHMGQLLAEL
ncbi:MAG: dCMP deaminase family protein [Halobacteriovoraceae bacterium]|jgi:dCMP deaminase|nr:dCMP deaminase family protein [Halobacteriovoraceae bacterium]MBT5094118.1 dCMP deaminase family protein [Halobacteriovoraceae bacterium]